MKDALFYEYLNRKKNGEDYSSIRKELENNGYTNTEISQIIKEIDEELLLSFPKKTRAIHPRMIIGLLLGIISITLFAFGMRSLIIYAALLSSLIMIAVRSPRRNDRSIKSKWTRH